MGLTLVFLPFLVLLFGGVEPEFGLSLVLVRARRGAAVFNPRALRCLTFIPARFWAATC